MSDCRQHGSLTAQLMLFLILWAPSSQEPGPAGTHPVRGRTPSMGYLRLRTPHQPQRNVLRGAQSLRLFLPTPPSFPSPLSQGPYPHHGLKALPVYSCVLHSQLLNWKIIFPKKILCTSNPFLVSVSQRRWTNTARKRGTQPTLRGQGRLLGEVITELSYEYK